MIKIKKSKGTKKCVPKRKVKFEDYKHCLEAVPLENKINHSEKNNVNVNSLWENHKEFLKRQLLLNAQQIFRSKNHSLFTEDVNKIAFSANDDKKIKSIDSIETYAYGTSKGLVSEKEEIKCNNVIKKYKKWLILMMWQRKA